MSQQRINKIAEFCGENLDLDLDVDLDLDPDVDSREQAVGSQTEQLRWRAFKRMVHV